MPSINRTKKSAESDFVLEQPGCASNVLPVYRTVVGVPIGVPTAVKANSCCHLKNKIEINVHKPQVIEIYLRFSRKKT